MGQPVVHFEIVGQDGDALRAFYSDLFDWEFQVIGGPMNYAVVARDGNTTADGVGINGGIGGAPDYEGHVIFYVAVSDIEAAIHQAEERGGKRLMGPDEVPGQGITVAHINDPQGNLVGLVQSLGG